MEKFPENKFDNESFRSDKEWGPLIYPHLFESDPMENAILAHTITGFLSFKDDNDFVELLRSGGDALAVDYIDDHQRILEAIKNGKISKDAPWFGELKDRMSRFGIYLASVGGIKDLEKGRKDAEEVDKAFEEADQKRDKLLSRLNQPKKRLDDWQNVTIDDLQRLIESGERIAVTIKRSSGEMDDDWEIFAIGPNEKIVVKKFTKRVEEWLTKNVSFADLKSWNQ